MSTLPRFRPPRRWRGLYRARLVGHRLGVYAARAAGGSRPCPIAAGGRKPCRSIGQVTPRASRKAGSARRGSPTVARLCTPEQVLLRGPDEALGAAVPFRRAHESRRILGARAPGRAPRPRHPSGVAAVTPGTREIISSTTPPSLLPTPANMGLLREEPAEPSYCRTSAQSRTWQGSARSSPRGSRSTASTGRRAWPRGG